jgi:predicted amidohydrolase
MRMKNLRVAAVCMNSEPGEIVRNLDRTEAYVLEASRKEVDIICFPELSITGYLLKNPNHVYAGAGPVQIIDQLAGMARKWNLIVIAGLIEISDGAKPYISQVVAGPEGVLGIYRKTHLSPNEKDCYEAGQRIDIFTHRDTTFGVQLCYESHFPEISTIMALKGAEIILIPHASPRGTPEEKTESWLRHLPGRAFDNALYVVACNQVGNTGEGLSFPGVALALSPAGRMIASYGGDQENMMLVDLSKDELQETRSHRMKYFMPNRRPELYRAIGPQNKVTV